MTLIIEVIVAGYYLLVTFFHFDCLSLPSCTVILHLTPARLSADLSTIFPVFSSDDNVVVRMQLPIKEEQVFPGILEKVGVVTIVAVLLLEKSLVRKYNVIVIIICVLHNQKVLLKMVQM